MIGLIVYVCLSALGLTLIKIGTGQNGTLLLDGRGFTLELSWVLVLGMVIYVISFLTSLVVMKKMNLNVFYPVSAGAIYVIVCIVSYFVLHENISVQHLIGMALILGGIIVMNLNKG